MNDSILRRMTLQNPAAQRSERRVSLAGHHVVGKRAEVRLIILETHLRPAQHHHRLRADPPKNAHHLLDDADIPDVNPQPHHPRPRRQDRLDNLQRPVLQRELHQTGLPGKLPKVGQ